GLVSVERARDIYGVVPGDAAATARLRAAAHPGPDAFDYGEARQDWAHIHASGNLPPPARHRPRPLPERGDRDRACRRRRRARPTRRTAQGRGGVASRIARQTTSGVAGMASSRTPSGASASISALPTAGIAPTAPASPAPFTPSGLVLVGTGFDSQWIGEKLSARGIA